MALLVKQRELVVTLKKETLLNVGLLSKVKAMPDDLTRLIFKENALEKPTQNVFNRISYYLVSIIDVQVSASFSWPLYDSKTERTYRNELANFISEYSSKGLLSPVMTSYLVNPGCYKVTLLIFQMSQLAMQKVLLSKIKKESQKKLYKDVTEKFKSRDKDFLEVVERETNVIYDRLSNYSAKQKALENIAELFRNKITRMEEKLSSTNAQKYLDYLVDTFIAKHQLDSVTKGQILQIKNVNRPAKFFDSWLAELDKKIDEIESKWDEKVSPFLQTCRDAKFYTESLIARQTGEAPKDTYMIEYNHKTDEICTKDLENQVNTQQKYILKNLVKDGRLNFPNLIRSFVIAISFILKNAEISDDIYEFNEHLDEGRRNYVEIAETLKELNNRVVKAEASLKPSSITHHSISIKRFPEIPPLPDLSDLRCSRELQYQPIFDSFTPLSMSKNQFNLRRRTTIHTFAKPQSKPLFTTPFYQKSKDGFMNNIASCRGVFDPLNATQNFQNLSIVCQPSKANETIAECGTGFTKQQIMRLLSTKKSSSKKFKYKSDRPSINIKKGGLFNETNSSNDSNGMYRSYSSPNLYENRDEKMPKSRTRKLSIMQEDSLPTLEVSGITALDVDSSLDTKINHDSCKQLTSTMSLPVTTILDNKFHNAIKDFQIDLDKELAINEPKLLSGKAEVKIVTPKPNSQLKHKTSSLEKLINRFRKVQANVASDDYTEPVEFRTIVEERDSIIANVDCVAKRVLLPDLLSPSCSFVSENSVKYLDQICMDVEDKVCRKPRESLGTALGVDETFLDQFDLID